MTPQHSNKSSDKPARARQGTHRPRTQAKQGSPKTTGRRTSRPATNRASAAGKARKSTTAKTHSGQGGQKSRRQTPQTGTQQRSASKSGRKHASAKNTRRKTQPKRPPRDTRRGAQTRIPEVEPGVIRVIPLGGVEEVGQNMTLVEYGDDIVIIDAGFEFVEEDMPGVDYILPNTQYLEERKDKIRGICITHGHLDHIGAIPYVIEPLGFPPIYTREMTALMIKKRQAEFPYLPELDYHTIEPGDVRTLGDLKVRFFEVTHSIPDSMGVAIETPHGNVVLSGDLKLDHIKGDPTDIEKERWSEVGSWNNLLFIADSTNAENPGFSATEREIYEDIEEIISSVSGRLIIGTFASQFERMKKIIEISAKYGKKVVPEGRSIKTNIEIAKESGRLKADNIIPITEMDSVPPEKLVILATGAQGEEFAALMRIGNSTHKYISLTNKDTILLSSSIIPGNELKVQKLKDALYQHDVRIIHYRLADVHASGHGNQEELKWINKQVGSRFFMPAYGYHSMVRVHAQTIEDNGFPKENIVVPKNGSLIEVHDKGKKIRVRPERAPHNIRLVDGFSIGDIQDVVIRDRQALAADGMFVVVVTLDANTGKLRKSPDLISRGFVYLRESQELLKEARELIRDAVESNAGVQPINFDYLKGLITDRVAGYLFQQTNKHPLVIPVILGI